MSTATIEHSAPIKNEDDAVDAKSGIPITILPELEGLLPPPSPEQKSELRRSVESEGIRDCLLVWRTVNDQSEEVRILIDGHNRYRLTESLGRDIEGLPVIDVDFVDMEEAKAWIIANQLMRRNLTDAQRSHFRGMAYEVAKRSHGGARNSSGHIDHLKTAGRLAEEFGVSERTIRRDAVFAKRVDALPPKEKAEVLAGKKRLAKVEKPCEPETPSDTHGEAESTPEIPASVTPSSTLSVNDVSSIILTKPHESLLLVYRAIVKAKDFIESMPTVTPTEHASLVESGLHLRGLLESLVKRIGEMCTVDPDKEESLKEQTTVDGDADF
jgi:hypothetical protein